MTSPPAAGAEQQRPIPWRCRLFGHKWKPCHRKDQSKQYGLPVWVYVDDVCQRCYSTEWRMPRG